MLLHYALTLTDWKRGRFLNQALALCTAGLAVFGSIPRQQRNTRPSVTNLIISAAAVSQSLCFCWVDTVCVRSVLLASGCSLRRLTDSSVRSAVAVVWCFRHPVGTASVGQPVRHCWALQAPLTSACHWRHRHWCHPVLCALSACLLYDVRYVSSCCLTFSRVS